MKMEFQGATIRILMGVKNLALFLPCLTLYHAIANSANDKTYNVFLIIPRNRIRHFMETVCMIYQIVFSRKNKETTPQPLYITSGRIQNVAKQKFLDYIEK